MMTVKMIGEKAVSYKRVRGEIEQEREREQERIGYKPFSQ